MFYVYVHRRKDTGAVFYVGKGKGARLRVTQHRSNWWRGIVKSAGGFDAVKVVDGIDEELSHLSEMELIDKYRRLGISLCNLTDGGEGMSGFVQSKETREKRAAKRRGVPNPKASAALKGVKKSAEHRAAISRSRTGIKISEEGRAKLSASRLGKPSALRGRSISCEHRANIIKNAPRGEANPFFGKTHSVEVMARIREANVGRKDSELTRLRKSLAKRPAPQPKSTEQIAKQRASLLEFNRLNRRQCDHCGKSLDLVNFGRWHGENCKSRKED